MASDGKEPLTFNSMRCLLSTSAKAYLYNVQQPALLASYGYPEETIHMCADQSFMYSVTQESALYLFVCTDLLGLEMFTLRTSMGIAVYKPPEPCLMGVMRFLGPKKVVIIGDHIILLSLLYVWMIYLRSSSQSSRRN